MNFREDISPIIDDKITPDDRAAVKRNYGQSMEMVASIIEQNRRLRYLGDRAFIVYESVPSRTEWDENKALFVLGEFGNGLNIPAVVRAESIRDAVDPNAKLFMLPNDSHEDHPSLDLSWPEKKQLWHGDTQPLVDRLQILSEPYEEVGVFGPSQGGTVGAAFASDANSPRSALYSLEAPDVRQRTLPELLKNFAGSGNKLNYNIEFNGARDETPIVEGHLNQINALGMLKFGHGIVLPGNIAIGGILRRNQLGERLRNTLERGGAVVHHWTDKDDVSPASDNWLIAEKLSHEFPLTYSYLELNGNTADHSVTNPAFVGIVGMREALNLLRAKR